jgi:hypothetical protein
MIEFYITSVVAVSLWVAAWLHWLFVGDIRHFLFAKIFPEKWRTERSPREILLMPTEEFEIFLGIESSAPMFVNGLLGCPGCSSAYLSAVGVVFTAPMLLLACGSIGEIITGACLLPLLWGGGAWLGHRLHAHF